VISAVFVGRKGAGGEVGKVDTFLDVRFLPRIPLSFSLTAARMAFCRNEICEASVLLPIRACSKSGWAACRAAPSPIPCRSGNMRRRCPRMKTCMGCLCSRVITGKAIPPRCSPFGGAPGMGRSPEKSTDARQIQDCLRASENHPSARRFNQKQPVHLSLLITGPHVIFARSIPCHFPALLLCRRL
jgi:hypothetical protein